MSNNDLLQTELSSTTSTGTFSREGEEGLPALVDGGFGPQGGQNANPTPLAAATAGTEDSITYTLNTSVHPLGYEITNVNTYAGWDGARYGQNYTVDFHLVGTPPGSHTAPITENFQPGALAGNNNTSVQISDSTGLLAKGADQIIFTFSNADSVPAGGYQGYRELDVIGIPVPEPSTFVLGGLVLVGQFVAARRRKA